MELLAFIIIGATIGSTIGATAGGVAGGAGEGARDFMKTLSQAAGISLIIYTIVSVAKK